ncbi:hypothetical protein [Paraflavitalea pollutisoli]|uniref:hypothetical protein n=1 Tax=Paraflavitalea pollutisoli TaxID=3034143 RepID=UPI0023EB0BCB|nr:hypothetical protein [Paraflavitalea sp. H1-2-19X]
MEKSQDPVPAYHQQFITDLRNHDATAINYLQGCYICPLIFILLPATNSFPEAFQIVIKTFNIARDRIGEYIDEPTNSIYMWLLRLMTDYLGETPGKEQYQTYLLKLVGKTQPPY